MLLGDAPDSIAAVQAKLYGVSCLEPEVSLPQRVSIEKPNSRIHVSSRQVQAGDGVAGKAKSTSLPTIKVIRRDNMSFALSS